MLLSKTNYSVYTRYKEAYGLHGYQLVQVRWKEDCLPNLKAALDKLAKTRDLIYYRPETKLYRFWEGPNPTGIEEEIEDKRHTDTH